MEGFVDSLWVIGRMMTFIDSLAVVGREQAVVPSFEKTNPKLVWPALLLAGLMNFRAVGESWRVINPWPLKRLSCSSSLKGRVKV